MIGSTGPRTWRILRILPAVLALLLAASSSAVRADEPPDSGPPTVTNVLLSLPSAAPGATVEVTADVDDDGVLAAAEVRIGKGGWIAADAADGAWNEAHETLQQSFVAPTGRSVQVCLRATDGAATTSEPVCVALDITGAAAIAAGDGFTCVLLADTTVRCFGAGDRGQLGTGLTADSSLPVAVRLDGSTLLSGVTVLAAGGSRACAVLAAGTVHCWGDDVPYATAIPGLDTAIAVSVGLAHTCVLRAVRDVWCWGRNADGQLGDGTRTDRAAPVRVKRLSGVVALAAGGAHTCALFTGKVVACWGRNVDGQLGDGTRKRHLLPTPVRLLPRATAIAAGARHTCARLATRKVRCWGDDRLGQVGDGGRADRLVPVPVGTLAGVSALSAGGNSSCAVVVGGWVKCWGDVAGRIRHSPRLVGGALPGRVALSTANGASHLCARMDTGAVVCWGSNLRGELGDGTTTAAPAPTLVRRLAGDARDRLGR